jgi:predicted amidophosphoribosyltransferase
MKVNLAKTKVMWMGSGKDHMEIGKFPCASCRRGVGSNSILCERCNKKHKRCSGIKGSLLKRQNFVCSRCKTGVKDQVLSTGLDIGNSVVLERVGSLLPRGYAG